MNTTTTIDERCDSTVTAPAPVTLAQLSSGVSTDLARLFWVSQLIDAARDAATHLATTDQVTVAVVPKLVADLNALGAEARSLLLDPYAGEMADRDFTLNSSATLAEVVYGAMRLSKYVDGLLGIKDYLAMRASTEKAIDAGDLAGTAADASTGAASAQYL